MNGREPSFFQHLECAAIPIGLTMLMVMIPVWLIRATLAASNPTTASFWTLILCAGAAFGTLGPFTQAA